MINRDKKCDCCMKEKTLTRLCQSCMDKYMKIQTYTGIGIEYVHVTNICEECKKKHRQSLGVEK